MDQSFQLEKAPAGFEPSCGLFLDFSFSDAKLKAPGKDVGVQKLASGSNSLKCTLLSRPDGVISSPEVQVCVLLPATVDALLFLSVYPEPDSVIPLR